MILSRKIRLEPNNIQRTAFAGHADIARFTYNHFLDLCQKQYEETKTIPSAIDMHKTLIKTLKVEYPWFYKYSKYAPQEELCKDLISIIHVFSSRLYGLRKYNFNEICSENSNNTI